MAGRTALNRQRVAAAALAFVDEHGMEALSMRKLGAELGVEAMSLYNHVASKDDLLDAVGDLLYREVLDGYRADADRRWQDDIREMARVYRWVAAVHRRALPLLMDRLIPSTVQVEFLGEVWRIFTKAGFPMKEAAAVFDAMASWMVGVIRNEFGLLPGLDAQLSSLDEAGALAAELQPVVDFTAACTAWTPDQRFEFGLDTLLAGIEIQRSRLA